MEASEQTSVPTITVRHRAWVKITHWLVTVSFLTLAFSGYVILMAHPRLYWGEVGNDLTPALIELPISRNHKHGGWENGTPMFENTTSPISANRSYSIFNQNGWGRSLHFMAAWVLALIGLIYLLAGLVTNHFGRHIVPGRTELSRGFFFREMKEHIRLRVRQGTGGPQYGVLQKCSYFAVIFLALPLAVISGLAMSPAITASYPILSRVFGGFQSARTIHFAVFVVLILFLIVHLVMIIRSGFKRQMRGMTFGE